MDTLDKVKNILSGVHDDVQDIKNTTSQLFRVVDNLRDDVEILFESQDMNVWVIVRGVCEGSIAPGEDPEDVLRAMGRLQAEYRAVVAVADFLRNMGRDSAE